MKTTRYFSILALLLVFQVSCDENEFLHEEPLDFYGAENSFATFENFQSAVVDLYAQTREYRYGAEGTGAHLFGTDVMFDARRGTHVIHFGSYLISLDPTSRTTMLHWRGLYKLVARANSVIDRLESNTVLTEDEKKLVEGEARFFRAYAYKYLVNLFGGVPLLLNEVTFARTDFTRATREEVLEQIIEDATIAAASLPSINMVADGRLSNLVAHHLLAETYITVENWDAAIAAASVVINDPNMALMTARFGSRAGEPGDVYYDLFREGNQNRSTGNKEALWVAQMEVDVPGGYLVGTNRTGNVWERLHVPASWTLQDPAGQLGVLGKRSDANIGGAGTSFMRPTPYFENEIWQSDFDNDIRNSPHNYVRDFIYDNPASKWYGMSLLDYPSKNHIAQDWRWYPWLMKATTPGKHPEPLYMNPDLKILLDATTGSTYTDQYYHRLAETYLLRAEAYLGKGNTSLAADDLNVIRTRANASSVDPGDVTIEYILAERARELNLEEDRRITLVRLGKLVERVRMYNAHNGDEIEDYHALWPIPVSEIEANINAELEQNPGYH